MTLDQFRRAAEWLSRQHIALRVFVLVRPPFMEEEAAQDYGVARCRGRVFADLWDLERIARCKACFGARRARLDSMNLNQSFRARIACGQCEGMT